MPAPTTQAAPAPKAPATAPPAPQKTSAKPSSGIPISLPKNLSQKQMVGIGLIGAGVLLIAMAILTW